MFRNLQCRLCKSNNLIDFLNLGQQSFTGIFPEDKDTRVPHGDLTLQRCEVCTLVQLAHTYDKSIMYGMNYGYRSSLNDSMKLHLQEISRFIKDSVTFKSGDVIVDIGSNDGTFLSFFEGKDLIRIGVDPTIKKFSSSYSAEITTIPDFFNRDVYSSASNKPAKFISSISMMYDLDDPIGFASDVADCLDKEGAWFFEQSYLGLMIEKLAYDTICHEHLEYYSAETIKRILEQVGLVVKDMKLNSVNGGSIAVLAVKKSNRLAGHCKEFIELLHRERITGLNTGEKLVKFRKEVEEHRQQLKSQIEEFISSGKRVAALGASTKGNVLLQYCDLDSTKISFIGDVNRDKFGCVTPGTLIPIIQESEVFERAPDVILILPWHFQETFLRKTSSFIDKGGIVVFPLPKIQVLQKLI